MTDVGGRPTKYKPEYDKQATKLCKLGATDKELADFFETTEQTINNWKKSQPSFFESLKKGKILADAEVADSLYNRAIGYSHVETKLAQVEGKFTDSVEVMKYYPPDTAAAFIWLKNRQPKQWRPQPEPEHQNAQPMNITFEVSEPVKDVRVTNAKTE